MINENIKQIFNQVPQRVQIVAAGKSRAVGEIKQAIAAGIRIVGENYVQEAEEKLKVIGKVVQWHFIGHLQKNKIKRAVKIFDMIQTLDCFETAQGINQVCGQENRVMPVLIEVNSAREKEKFGLFPEDAESLIREIYQFKHIKVVGLMTMGPNFSNQEELRPYFRETRQLFERIKSLNLPGVEMRYLSMGMSDSYQIAIQERANLVRIGTAIFGKRRPRH
ncbi:MAG: YggS family pyridoxal phosphate-dependent enzyme [Candidatus Omnitrophota bacterium]|jgi:pyridoxal phosphate enzyme (YggS family)